MPCPATSSSFWLQGTDRPCDAFHPFLCLSHVPDRSAADEMQLADELPMIYTVCIMGFATFSYRRTLKVQILIGLALFALAVFITVSAVQAILHTALCEIV
jgi:hypothetical protein